jgi:hypothetical protein
MPFVKGPNGLVVVVPDEQIYSLVGDGSRGYEVVPNPREVSKPAATPKRAPRKATPK